MKLSNIRRLGRYENTKTKQKINVWIGTNRQRGTDHSILQQTACKIAVFCV
jgi:hypothetical protein